MGSPDRQINHYQQAVVMRNRSFVKHACTRTHVPHIDSPSNTFHNRANRRANTRSVRLSAKNRRMIFHRPAGILIIITPFHLRSPLGKMEEKKKKKTNGIEGLDIGYWNRGLRPKRVTMSIDVKSES